jgi:DNA-binding beta-propeller fold protein YncE
MKTHSLVPAEITRKRSSLLVTAGCVALALTTVSGAAPPKIALGNGTMYMGAYSGDILAVDEATEKVSLIKLKSGFPYQVRISADGTRLYALNSDMERFEVVDIVSKQNVDAFTLSEGNTKVRVLGYAIDPQQHFIAIATRAATKLPDRFEIGPPTLVLYDLRDHKIVKSQASPAGEEDTRSNLRFSPDGKLLYVFGHEVAILNASTFEQVDKWEMSRPLEAGLGRGNIGPEEDAYEDPTYFTSLFTVEDALQRRKILGIGQINLAKRSVDFFPLFPAPEGRLNLAITPDRKRGFILYQVIDNYQMMIVDLVTHKTLQKIQFDGRPRMQVRTSTNGKAVYIFEAGNTIDVYDAADFKYNRTITLDTDMTYWSFHVVPPRTSTVATTAGRP